MKTYSFFDNEYRQQFFLPMIVEFTLFRIVNVNVIQ